MPSDSLHVQSGPAPGPRDAIPSGVPSDATRGMSRLPAVLLDLTCSFLSDRHLWRLAAASSAFYNSPPVLAGGAAAAPNLRHSLPWRSVATVGAQARRGGRWSGHGGGRRRVPGGSRLYSSRTSSAAPQLRLVAQAQALADGHGCPELGR